MNIVLKDRDANPVVASGVSGVNLLTDTGEEVVVEKVTPIKDLYYYYAKQAGSNAESAWEITGNYYWANAGGAVGTVFEATESTCREYGYLNEAGDEYRLALIVSKVPLTVGGIYTTDQICNG